MKEKKSEVQATWRRDYAKVMLEDLRIACQLYLQNSDKPESLMLALYHAQQASEKAIKLFLVLTGLIEDPANYKYGKSLGHKPLIETLKDFHEKIQGKLKEARRSLGERGPHIEFINSYSHFIGEINKTLDDHVKQLHDCQKAPCLAFDLQPVIKEDLIGKIPDIFTKLQKFAEKQGGSAANDLIVLFATFAVILNIPVIMKEKLNQDIPQYFVTHIDEILRELEKKLTDPKTLREYAEIFFEELERSSTAELREPLNLFLQARGTILEAISEPSKIYSYLVSKEQLSGLPPIFSVLAYPLAFLLLISDLSVQLPGTDKTILDYIIWLDAFESCGRYVEPVDNTTTLEVFKRNKDK
ncbi:MAG: hypothetical protein ACPLSM_03450, partial [Thermosphaera sp.]